MKHQYTASTARNRAYGITLEQKHAIAKALRRTNCTSISELTSPGKRILFLRFLRGITQRDLAEAVGIRPSTLSRYERELSNVNLEILPLFVEQLHTTTGFLLGHTKNPERPPAVPGGRSVSNTTLTELEKQILQLMRSFPEPYISFFRESTYHYLSFLLQHPDYLREVDYAIKNLPKEDTSLHTRT